MIAEYKQQKCEQVKQNSQEYRRYTNNNREIGKQKCYGNIPHTQGPEISKILNRSTKKTKQKRYTKGES